MLALFNALRCAELLGKFHFAIMVDNNRLLPDYGLSLEHVFVANTGVVDYRSAKNRSKMKAIVKDTVQV